MSDGGSEAEAATYMVLISGGEKLVRLRLLALELVVKSFLALLLDLQVRSIAKFPGSL